MVFCVFFLQVIPQYERAIIFRLGRIKGGRPQGPGLFFIIPCIDSVQRVDMRLKTFDVPPQKVYYICIVSTLTNVHVHIHPHTCIHAHTLLDVVHMHKHTRIPTDPLQRQCHGTRRCHCQLPNLKPHHVCEKYP